MTRIPTFIEALEKMKEVHIKKNEDYADPNNPFSNFDVSEYLISIFKSDRDKTFVWPIATKLARLATLLNSDRVPNNESIEDTFIDIANYVLLWRSDYLLRRSKLIMGDSQIEPGMITNIIRCKAQFVNSPDYKTQVCTLMAGHSGEHFQFKSNEI